jgi:hypothetical protein
MILTRFRLERVYLPTSTPGSWYPTRAGDTLYDEPICKTLELPYRNNSVSPDPKLASCVMEGIYLFIWQPPNADRPYEYYRCVFAPGRNWHPDTRMSSILVHPITYVSGLLGCIGVGSRHADLNKDGIPDIAESKVKLAWMTKNLPRHFELEIVAKPKPAQ